MAPEHAVEVRHGSALFAADGRSIFTTMILLSTDGATDAELALTTAVDLADSTDLELHMVHVGRLPKSLQTHPIGVHYLDCALYEATVQVAPSAQSGDLLWNG